MAATSRDIELFQKLLKTPYKELSALYKEDKSLRPIISNQKLWVLKLKDDYDISREEADHFFSIEKFIKNLKYVPILRDFKYQSLYGIIYNANDETKLALAILIGNIFFFEDLLRKIGGLDQIEKYEISRYVFSYAAIGGNVHILQKLMGLPIRKDINQMLIYAVEANNLDIVKYLLNQGYLLADNFIKDIYAISVNNRYREIGDYLFSLYTNILA